MVDGPGVLLPDWAIKIIQDTNAAGPPPPPPPMPSGQPVPYVPISGRAYDAVNVQTRNESFETFLSFVAVALALVNVGLSYTKLQAAGNTSYPAQPAMFIFTATGPTWERAGVWTLYHYDLFQCYIEKALAMLLPRR